MSMLVVKSSPEFRRPPSVQRNKGGLAKYLGGVTPNGRIINDWEVRTMTISPPLAKKLPNVTPRVSVTKLDKMLVAKALPSLPIITDVLTNMPACKITSSLRLNSETSPKTNVVTPSSNSPILATESETIINFDNATKPIVHENNNITSTCTSATHITNTRSQLTINQEHPLVRLSSSLLDARKRDDEVKTSMRTGDDEDEEEEEEEDSSRSSESKRESTSSSPILSAPTTIRFPARTPAKNGARAADSGICRWDKCNADFECSGALLEHLQVCNTKLKFNLRKNISLI